MLPRIPLTAALLVLLAAGSVSAQGLDYVYKKSDGKAAGGTVSKIERNAITVTRNPGGPVTIPSTDVDYVQWKGESQDLKNGRRKENGGDLAEALAAFEAAAKTDMGNAKVDAEFLGARVAAKLAANDAAKLDAAIARLDGFRKANANSFRYYPALALLGDLYTRKKSFAEANTVFGELESAPTNDVKWAARNAKARVLLAEGKLDEALAAYGRVVGEKASTPVETARRYEAMLGEAECLRQKKDFNAAVAKLEQVVGEVSPRETRIQAAAYLLEGACYKEMSPPRSKQALFAYLHVDLLFPSEPAMHAEALYHLVGLWQTVGKPARAQAVLGKLTSRYPKSEWTKKAGG